MSLCIGLKVFSDCCIVFAILGAFPSVFYCSRPLLLAAIICGLAAGLSSAAKNRPVLEKCCALLPFLSLLLAASWAETAIIFPAALYSAAVIFMGRMQLEYYSYRQFFSRSLMMLAALYGVLSAFTVLEGIGADEMRIIHPEYTLRYGVVHLICGILLQRRLRLGAEKRASGDTGQLAVMLGGTVLAICGFLITEPLLRRGAAAMFQTVLSIVLGGLMKLVDIFSSLLDQVELLEMQKQVSEHREDVRPSYGMGTVTNEIQQVLEEAPDEPSLWWVPLVALLVVIAVIFMLRSFRKKGSSAFTSEVEGAAPPMPTERKAPRTSNRARIRKLYRDFLRMERRRGLLLQKHHTSADVLERISPDTRPDAAASLREIYIRARYDELTEPSREDYEAAKSALRRIKEGI